MLRVLENVDVTGSHSGSFEFTPLSRACVSSCWYFIVNNIMSLSCIVSEIFYSNNVVPLKSDFGIIQGHGKWHHLIDRTRDPIRLPL